MKILKWVMIAGFWFIVFGIVYALGKPDAGGAIVRSLAGYLPIILVAAVLYGIIAGIRKLRR